MINTLHFSVEQLAGISEFRCPALCLKGHPPLPLSLSLKSRAEQTLHWLTEGASLRLRSALWKPLGEKNLDASGCYLRMRVSVGWNEMLDIGLREDISFYSGTQFLEAMINAQFCWGVPSILARLWPCSCYTVNAACEMATLNLQTGLNGSSLSCRCFLTEANLSAHHKLLPGTLADSAAEKLPFVCLWFRLCSKSPIVRGYF